MSKNNMKTYTAWGVWTGKTMFPDFFRVRANAQIYAARRGMSGEEFRRLCAPVEPIEDFTAGYRTVRLARLPSRLWRVYLRDHKGAKLVRVRVSAAK
jgi:hypothetical protein